MLTLPPGLLVLTKIVRILTVLGAAALCVVPAAFWLTRDWVLARGGIISGIGNHPMALDERAMLLGALSSLPGVALGLYALWQLWCLFGEYSEGLVFGQAAQKHLRRFAWGILLMALATPFLRAAMGVALTLGNPPGQRLLALGFGWDDYVSILTGAVLLAVATVMTEAVRLAEENDGFV
ncbi:MAG: DUF2975 domain-containing protein [Ideonella sp.]|nr:DUF2975 domain-containing protein [Ideonella sp.]MBL0148205.1 DUF2975 domain-containing protein [Ideonella sp.]